MRDVVRFADGFAAPSTERSVDFTVVAGKGGHVFNNRHARNFQFRKHSHAFIDIDKCQPLRRGHNKRRGYWNHLA